MTDTSGDVPGTELTATIRDFLGYLDEPYAAAAVNGYLADRAVLARRADGGA